MPRSRVAAKGMTQSDFFTERGTSLSAIDPAAKSGISAQALADAAHAKQQQVLGYADDALDARGLGHACAALSTRNDHAVGAPLCDQHADGKLEVQKERVRRQRLWIEQVAAEQVRAFAAQRHAV